jgi:hypothetical protein
MILISGTFTLLSRLVGSIAGTTLGWAVILLFGRVPHARQRLLSFIALASIGWLVAVAALLLPAVWRLIVSAVPRVGFGSDVIGWAILAAAVLLPAAVGAATTQLSAEDDPTRPVVRVGQVLRGYPFTMVLAVTIVFLAAWSIVRGARAAGRGWQSVHVPMIVKPHAYEGVVDDLAASLAAAGLEVTRSAASRWFVVLPHLLAVTGGLSAERTVPDRLYAFVGRDLQILVYPSDVAVMGEERSVAVARSATARRLAFSDAYLTTALESEQIEDRLRELGQRPFVQATDFQPIDAMLMSLPVPYDEWETLLRLRLQVEHEVLETRRVSTVGRA